MTSESGLVKVTNSTFRHPQYCRYLLLIQRINCSKDGRPCTSFDFLESLVESSLGILLLDVRILLFKFLEIF